MTYQFALFVLNGIVATVAHFGTLTLAVEGLNFLSSGFANFLASLVGITVSFFGNRYIVFRETTRVGRNLAVRFVLLYGSIALMNGVILFLWSDLLGLDYRIGFVLALIFQVLCSFFGNKRLVFT